MVTLFGGLAIIVVFATMMGNGAGPDAAVSTSGGESSNAPEMTRANAVNTEPVADSATDLAMVTTAEAKPVASGNAGREPLNGEASAEVARRIEPDENGWNAAIPLELPGVDTMAPVVRVAETADEILALEEIQQREVEADLGMPSNEKTAAIQPAVVKVAAVATKWVNMRAGPSDGAQVLLVVPALAEIAAESACGWCAVSYDGRHGYIYKTFISYE